jgi:hypothetical protein
LDQPLPWRAKLRRWLPYVIDQHIVSTMNARFSKEWQPTPWPAEKPTDTGDRPASVREAQAHLSAFSRRIEAMRAKSRSR